MMVFWLCVLFLLNCAEFDDDNDNDNDNDDDDDDGFLFCDDFRFCTRHANLFVRNVPVK